MNWHALGWTTASGALFANYFVDYVYKKTVGWERSTAGVSTRSWTRVRWRAVPVGWLNASFGIVPLHRRSCAAGLRRGSRRLALFEAGLAASWANIDTW